MTDIFTYIKEMEEAVDEILRKSFRASSTYSDEEPEPEHIIKCKIKNVVKVAVEPGWVHMKAQEAEIESLKKALRNYLEKHNKDSEARYFLKEKRIEKDTIIECDCECCEVGRILLNGHYTRS